MAFFIFKDFTRKALDFLQEGKGIPLTSVLPSYLHFIVESIVEYPILSLKTTFYCLRMRGGQFSFLNAALWSVQMLVLLPITIYPVAIFFSFPFVFHKRTRTLNNGLGDKKIRPTKGKTSFLQDVLQFLFKDIRDEKCCVTTKKHHLIRRKRPRTEWYVYLKF